MEIRNNKAIVHVTEVGGCIRKGILRALGEPEQCKYYHSQLGTATHHVSEHMLSGLIAKAPLNSGYSMEYVYNTIYKDQPDMFWDKAKPEIEQKVRRLTQWIEWNKPGILDGLLSVEHQMELNLDGEIASMPVVLSGTADIITNDLIIDIKSGKSRDKRHVQQLAGYHLLYSKPMLGGKIVYLGSDRFEVKIQKNGKAHVYHERDIPEEELIGEVNKFIGELAGYVNRLRAHYPEPPDPVKCGDCFFCPYRVGCYGEQSEGGRTE